MQQNRPKWSLNTSRPERNYLRPVHAGAHSIMCDLPLMRPGHAGDPDTSYVVLAKNGLAERIVQVTVASAGDHARFLAGELRQATARHREAEQAHELASAKVNAIAARRRLALAALPKDLILQLKGLDAEARDAALGQEASAAVLAECHRVKREAAEVLEDHSRTAIGAAIRSVEADVKLELQAAHTRLNERIADLGAVLDQVFELQEANYHAYREQSKALARMRVTDALRQLTEAPEPTASAAEVSLAEMESEGEAVAVEAVETSA